MSKNSQSRVKAHGTATASRKVKPEATQPEATQPEATQAEALPLDSVATPITNEPLVIGEVGKLQWWQLHGFSDRNIRALVRDENGVVADYGSFGDPMADLAEQIKQLGEKTVEGGKIAETDDDRRHGPRDLVGLLIGGWKESEVIPVTIPTPDEQRLAVEERRQQLSFWRGRGQAEPMFIALAAFVEGYWFPKGEPSLVGGVIHSHHRRTFTLPAVAFARQQRQIGKNGDYAVTVRLREALPKLVEIDTRLAENLAHDMGRSPMSPLDYLKTAKMIVDAGGSESMLRKYYKVGEAQTSFRYMTLASRYPQLRLYERAMTPRPEPGVVNGKKQYPYTKGTSYIPYSTSMKESLGALLADKNWEGSGNMASRTPLVCTAEVIEECMAYYTLGGRVKTGWNAQDTKNLQSAKYSPIFNLIAYAIEHNKKEIVDLLQQRFGQQFDDIIGRDMVDKIKTGKLDELVDEVTDNSSDNA